MSQPMISKPLFALLLLSAVLSVIALLTPPQDGSDSHSDDDLLADFSAKKTKQPTDVALTTASTVDWQRHLSEFKTIKPKPDISAIAVKPIFTPPIPVFSQPVITPTTPTETRAVAPNVPFSYLGRLIGADKTTVFLSVNDENMAVNIGDVLDKVWKVESISETAVNFRYLPSNSPQQLVISEP